MKTLFITDIVSIGGTTTYLENITNAYALNGHQLSLIAFSENREIEPSVTQFGFKKILFIRKTRSFRPIFIIERTIKLYFCLKKFLATNQVDSILIDLIFPAFSLLVVRSLFAKELKNVKIIYQFHGFDSLEKGYEISSLNWKQQFKHYRKKLRLSIDAWILTTLPDTIIVFSNYAAQLLRENHVGTSILQIKPGVEKTLQKIGTKFSKQKAREQLGFSEKAKIALIASRLEHRKGVLDFFGRITKDSKLANIVFVVASDFGYEEGTYDFFKLLAKQKLTTAVHSISRPSREDLALLYRAADATILPSLDLETFGLVTLESMSVGTPVVAFAIGANPELIEKAFLADSKHPLQLTKKILNLLEMTPTQRLNLEAKMIQITKKYSWDAYIQSINAIVTLNT